MKHAGRAVALVLMAVGLVTLVAIGMQNAPRDPNGRCMVDCHGDPDFKEETAPGKFRSLYVDYEAFQNSIHGDRLCTDCHTDVNTLPHPERPEDVSCLQCHRQGNVVGAPTEEQPWRYQNSVHANAAERGNEDAPYCTTCHGVHNVLPPDDSDSTVHRANISDTCGQCHTDVFATYARSVHATAVDEENLDSAVCSDCHEEHDILPPEDPRSSINPQNINHTCAECHNDQTVMRRENVPVKQVEAYEDSFHGIAVKFGELDAANCTSCHEHHLILSQENPNSPIHKSNLDKTCGQCHPNATSNVALGRVHVVPSDPSAGIVFYVAQFFKWLTLSVLAVLFIHILIDLFGRLRHRRRAQE